MTLNYAERFLFVGMATVVCRTYCHAEDPLDHFNWKNVSLPYKRHWKNVSLPYKRPWIRYVEKILERILESNKHRRHKNIHFRDFQSILLLITIQTRKEEHQVKDEVGLPPEPKRHTLNIVSNVSYPLYLIYVPDIYDIKYDISIVYTWLFKVYRLLRVKITFVNLKMYAVFGYCPIDAKITSIFHNSHKTFTYCGVISLFSIYPPDNKISFQFHISKVWYVRLNTTFDLISANIIENYKLEDNKFYKSIHVYHLKLIKTYIATYKIVVNKYQKIVLFVQFPSKTQSIVFSGPGYLTQKIIIKSESQPIVINNFQIIVEFVMNYFEDISIEDLLFKYTTLFGEFNTELLLKTKMGKTLSFSSRGLHTSAILLIQSPKTSSVNVTIVYYSFQGVYDPTCPYGAVSFFEDSNLTSITEIKSICSSSYEGYFQNVYSSTGRMLIVFYSYREYSSLNVTVSVSYTRCKAVRIQSCLLFITCLQRYEMTGTKTKCWEDQKYKLQAVPDKRRRTWYPQVHISGPVPSVRCTILQMISDPQYNPQPHTNLYHKYKLPYGCSFYLNFISDLNPAWWSFRIAGYLSHPSRFHIVKEPETVVLESVYRINKQGNITKGGFNYDRCSSYIMNIKPTRWKDMAMDLVHSVNIPENLLYFVYFNMWTKDNINPSWLDILVTMGKNTSKYSEYFVIFDKIPYELRRMLPKSDYFLMLSFPTEPRGNSSDLFLEAETDKNYTSVFMPFDEIEYLVVHWKKIYNVNVKQKQTAIALPGAIRKMTARCLEDHNITVYMKCINLHKMSIHKLKYLFCRSNRFKEQKYKIGNGDIASECYSFKLPLFYYALRKIVPPTYMPTILTLYPFYYPIRHNPLYSTACVSGVRKTETKYSWIETAKTCKRKWMSLPEFLSQ